MAPWSPQLHPTKATQIAASQLLNDHGMSTISPWRVDLASEATECSPRGRCVVYLMRRTQRGIDNPALDIAVHVAQQRHVPLVTIFKLGTGPASNNWRHSSFMIDGLADAAASVIERGACWAIAPWDSAPVTQIISQLDPVFVVTDDDVMQGARRSRTLIAQQLKAPMMVVDNDVIVPGTRFDRCEYAARTIRPRIHMMLDEHLYEMASSKPTTHVANVVTDHILEQLQTHGCVTSTTPQRDRLQSLHASIAARHPTTLDVPGIDPIETPAGQRAAETCLTAFLDRGLNGYANRRNHPDVDGTSGLSRFLHYGHISPATIVRRARDAASNGTCEPGDIAAFVEELVVRRELAHNYVRFNEHAAELKGAPSWAQATLDAHASDPREWIYDLDQLTAASTHDPLWNAAQRQMIATGHMHGYVRMYWAKKILEWSTDPETAFEHALTLNDRWHLDGRDPSGIVGVAWAIAGVHDRPWTERPIFGTIRFMSLASTGRKFNSRGYITRWSETASSLF